MLQRAIQDSGVAMGKPTNYEEFQRGVQFAEQIMEACLYLYPGTMAENVALGYEIVSKAKGIPLVEHINSFINFSINKRWAFDSLIHISRDLNREGEPLPPGLREWLDDVLADQLLPNNKKKRPRPKRPPDPATKKPSRGPDSGPNFARQIVVYLVIKTLEGMGWTAVGNEADFELDDKGREWGNSAALAVARASEWNFDTVRKVWSKRREE